jgi:hypothetical protein
MPGTIRLLDGDESLSSFHLLCVRYRGLTFSYRYATVKNVPLRLSSDAQVECNFDCIAEYLPGWVLPADFTVTWDDPGLPAIVKIAVVVKEGRPSCRGLTVTGRNDERVDGGVLRRIPVSTLLDYAVTVAAMRSDDRRRLKLFKSPDDFRALRALRPVHKERERWQLTPEHLAEVVEVYNQAHTAPVMEVARRWKKPRATASRWVARARAEGYFDRAVKSSVGPTRSRKGTK